MHGVHFVMCHVCTHLYQWMCTCRGTFTSSLVPRTHRACARAHTHTHTHTHSLSTSSGRWRTLHLSAQVNATPPRQRVTILDALTSWMALNDSSEVIRYTDTCQGIHKTHSSVTTSYHIWSAGSLCNDQCPDEIALGRLTSNSWPLSAKVVIVIQTFGVAIVCVILKVLFLTWLFWLEHKQETYLSSLESDIQEDENIGTRLQVRLYYLWLLFMSTTCMYSECIMHLLIWCPQGTPLG